MPHAHGHSHTHDHGHDHGPARAGSWWPLVWLVGACAAAVYLSTGVYVVATDAGTTGGEFKLFKLDRLSRVAPRDEHFKPREDFDPQELFAASVGVYRSRRAQRFRIRLSGPAARWVLEEPLHPKQLIRPSTEGDETGEVVLEIPSAYEEEIIRGVLALGDHAEVLEPESCRDALEGIARRMVDRYAANGD